MNDDIRPADVITWMGMLLILGVQVFSIPSIRPTDKEVVLTSKLRFAEQEAEGWAKRYFDLESKMKEKNQ